MPSPAWKYFTKLGSGAKGDDGIVAVECNLCGKRMAYNQSTSSLLRHVQKTHHRTAHKVEVGNSENVITIFEEDIVEGNVSQVSTVDVDPWGGELAAQTVGQASVYEIQLVPQEIKPPRIKKQKILDIATSEIYSTTNYAKNCIDEKLIAMIAIDMQPVEIVENVGFCELLKTIEPRYKIPSRQALITMMNDEVVAARTRCKEELQAVNDVALATDCWTSNSNDSFLSVTCYYFNEIFCLQTRLLDVCMVTEPCNAHNLATLIRRALDECNLDNKVVCISTDGSTNTVAAVQIQALRHVLCMAHTINSLVKNAIESVEALTNVLAKMRTVVEHLKHSPSANAKFQEALANLNLSGKKLILDVETQWISTFLMMERLMELREPVSAVVNETEDLPTMFPSDWRAAERCFKVLQPFVLISKELSADKSVAISKMIPIARNLLRLSTQLADDLREENLSEFGDLDDAGHALASSISVELQRITKDYEKSRILGIATLLDPRFKKLAFGGNTAMLGVAVVNLTSEAEKLAQHLSDEHKTSKTAGTAGSSAQRDGRSGVSAANSQSEDDGLWADFDKEVEQHSAELPNTAAAQEVNTYLTLPNMKRCSSIGEFWFKYQMQFPILSALARKYLCGQATCVPPERMFLDSGEIFSNRRARLSEENVKLCMFLNKY